MKKRKLVFGIFAAILTVGIFGFYLGDSTIAFMQQSEKKKTKTKQLDENVQKLLKELNAENILAENPEKLSKIIDELGQRRISESIPNLIKYLDVERKSKFNGGAIGLRPLPIGGDFPAVSALFQIGESALPALIEVITKEQTDLLKSKNALRTIHLIFREDLSKAVEYLEKSMAQAETSGGKQNLQKAVEKTKDEWIKSERLNSEQ